MPRATTSTKNGNTIDAYRDWNAERPIHARVVPITSAAAPTAASQRTPGCVCRSRSMCRRSTVAPNTPTSTSAINTKSRIQPSCSLPPEKSWNVRPIGVGGSSAWPHGVPVCFAW